MMGLAVHANALRPLGAGFQTAAEAAFTHELSHIQSSPLDGQHFVQALDYELCTSLQSNPRALKQHLDNKGLNPCQLDASFPMMGL